MSWHAHLLEFHLYDLAITGGDDGLKFWNKEHSNEDGKRVT